jgi:hypothetical protein
MELYIARDKDGKLFLYNYLPNRNNDSGNFMEEVDDMWNGEVMRIDPKLFPEVTWENSPKQVELKLI